MDRSLFVLSSVIRNYITFHSEPHEGHALQQAYQRLCNSYRNPNNALKHSAVLLSTDTQQLAYLSVRLPATYAVCQMVLRHLVPYQDQIETVYDLGCGPGTASYAALDQLKAINQIYLTDQTLIFKKFINYVMQNHSVNYSVQSVSLPWSVLPYEKSNLTIMSYMLNELNDSSQKKLLEQVWQISNNFVVIIEPGSVIGSNNILRARDMLINQGAFILAPCPHRQPCPLKKPDWCHFNCRLMRSKLHQHVKGAKLSYEDEKYSYLIVSKKEISTDIKRIIKKPIINKGHVLLDICDKSGIKRTCISKKHQIFRKARHSQWGDNAQFLNDEDETI